MEKSLRFDSLETNRLDTFGHNIEDRLRNIHKEFPSNVKAKDGVYGIQEIQKENGLVERIGRNEQNNVYKEYLRDGQLYYLENGIPQKPYARVLIRKIASDEVL